MIQRNHFLRWSLLLLFCFSICVVSLRVSYEKSRTVVTISNGIRQCQGQSVLQIQQRLKDLGYYKGEIDGISGLGTKNALIQFQQDNGLSADGVADESTLSALGISFRTGFNGVGDENDGSYEEDVQLLATAIHAESRGEPYEGQVAVGAVMVNRVLSDQFPDTITGVLTQYTNFELEKAQAPDQTAMKAAKDAIEGWDPTNGAMYYWDPSVTSNQWMLSLTSNKIIGKYVFGKISKE